MKDPKDYLIDLAEVSLKKIKILGKNSYTHSISRMGRNSIIEFPVLFGSGITEPARSTIAKDIERQLAAFLLMYTSLNNTVDLSRYPSIGDYLKQFSNTSAIPSNLKYASKLIDDTVGYVKKVTESRQLRAVDFTIKSSDYIVPMEKSIAMDCWFSIDDALEETSINDLYKPYTSTKQDLTLMIDALEASNKKRNYNELRDLANSPIGASPQDFNTSAKISPGEFRDFTAVTKDTTKGKKIDKNGNTEFNREERTSTRTDKEFIRRDQMYATNFSDKDSVPQIINDKSTNTFEPTLVQCEFLVIDRDKNGSSSTMLETVIFGVKAMARSIPMNSMIANMCQAVTDSNIIFKFIKWTNGELKFAKDLIFGISQAKQDAKANKFGEKIFANLRSLARKSKIARAFGKSLPVTTTIIITTLEADEIEKRTGIDLREDINALNLMKKQFLLGFGIYDENRDSISLLFDGYDTFSESSISALRNMNKKDTSLNDFKELLKSIGRYN